MADAERDRVELTTRIGQLEMDKRALEEETARKEEENSSLSSQLELLNAAVADSETRIMSLEATLQSSQQAVRRLESAAARAADMERHLAIMEAEQASLQSSLIDSESESRSALQRWRKAERSISDLQVQLERMEREAEEERERHAEVMGRMERQRAMERGLDTAAGRLKGAAAVTLTKTLNDGRAGGGGSVISHFVRDLLQDNANLQWGMAELREMLANSNDEIQMLRDQLMMHQPLAGDDISPASTLRAELEPPPIVPSISQELHIHHHYHVAKPDPKRPKKRRQGLSTGIFTPPAATPSTPPSGPWRLTHPAVHAPKDSMSTVSCLSNRWSVFSDQPSEFAPSSVPSSPISNPRNSVFDRCIPEDAVPISPTTSIDPTSPTWRAAHRKNSSHVSARSMSMGLVEAISLPADHTPDIFPAGYMNNPVIPKLDSTPNSPAGGSVAVATATSEPASSTIPDDASISTDTETPTNIDSLPDFGVPDTDPEHGYAVLTNVDFSPRRPTLHRAVSHESIMSLKGGLDIHTLKIRPSQLSLRPLGAITADTGLSAVTARPTISTGIGNGKRGSMVLRDSLALGQLPPRNRIVSGPSGLQSTVDAWGSGKLGRLVSWRPWGGSPNNSPSTTTEGGAADAQGSPTERKSKNARERDALRAAGINQPGVIPGFDEYWATHQRRGPPTHVHPDTVDRDALREVLEDG